MYDQNGHESLHPPKKHCGSESSDEKHLGDDPMNVLWFFPHPEKINHRIVSSVSEQGLESAGSQVLDV